MTAPKRIQRRRTKGWRMPEGAVYVGRPTWWGNPFPIGNESPFNRDDAVRMCRELLVNREAWLPEFTGTAWETGHRFTHWHSDMPVPLVEEVRLALNGYDLACWCPLDQPCHADVLLELANGGDA